VRTSLQQGTEYVALVSKGHSNQNEVSFSLKFQAICTCQKHTPETCFGTIGPNFRVDGGLRTADAFSKFALSCGSTQSNLNDFIFNFQVAQSGVYRISLINVKNGNSSLQINDCDNNQFFDCQAGNSQEVGGSVVETFLPSGHNLYGTVSKFDQNSNEVSIICFYFSEALGSD
jgi:hypothetical protein